MSKKQKEATAEKNLENINEALTSSEQFIEKNQNTIMIALGIIIAVVLAVLAYNNFYKKPKNERAQAAIFKGERYFQNQQDSLALFGDGNDYIGFEEVINQYGGTKTADLAKAYAGISYSRLGDNEKALNYLDKFKGGDKMITPAITGAVGDVYMNLDMSDKAANQFLKAAKDANDNLLSPIYYKKAGLAYLHAQNFDKAISTFETIKKTYLNSPEG
ncbi:MAG TPA: tetratricopeptide repeat protein, partial [Bacteroidales bacterium]|nr:tetratricopeptide repeat protein [Bacteroidales bacterium]